MINKLNNGSYSSVGLWEKGKRAARSDRSLKSAPIVHPTSFTHLSIAPTSDTLVTIIKHITMSIPTLFIMRIHLITFLFYQLFAPRFL